MPVSPRGEGYLVTVNRSDALEGYQRIRKQVSNYELGTKLEGEINAAIDANGMWPIGQHASGHKGIGRKPRTGWVDPKRVKFGGTLRLAATETFSTIWKINNPRRAHQRIKSNAKRITNFFEARGKFDLEDIQTEDVYAFVEHLFGLGLSHATVVGQLGFLKTINKYAMNHNPPLASSLIPIQSVKFRAARTPIALADICQVSMWHLDNNSRFLADFFKMMALLQLSFEGVRALRPEHFTKLEGGKAYIQIPQKRKNQIPERVHLTDEGIGFVEGCIGIASYMGWGLLFPEDVYTYKNGWKKARKALGVKGAELKHFPRQKTGLSPRLRLTF